MRKFSGVILSREKAQLPLSGMPLFAAIWAECLEVNE